MPTIHKGAENKPGDTSNSRIIGLSEQPHTKYLAHLIVLVVITTYLIRAIKNNHLSLGKKVQLKRATHWLPQSLRN